MNITTWAIRQKFSDVEQAQTDEDIHKNYKHILDIRPDEEYAVSKIPTAVQVLPELEGDDLTKRLDDLGVNKNDPVLVYCSVGYRSCIMAQRMHQLGYDNVRNLEGSIFKWANESRPMVGGDGNQAKLVHPYNSTFGRLLDRDRRAPLPKN
eukprot:Clim_evm2s8 gene=Clim_evmTU2s8